MPKPQRRKKRLPALDTLPKERAVAMLLKLKHYNPGKPCPSEGHIAPRRVNDDRCVECSTIDSMKRIRKRQQEIREMNEYRQGNGEG
jgi:hypothetical protein